MTDMNNVTLAQAFYAASRALDRCEKSGNLEWVDKWRTRLKELTALLPSGSGFDNGCHLIGCTDNELVFSADYHPMNDDGYYIEWEEWRVIATPRFDGIDVKVSGITCHDHNGTKEYVGDALYDSLITMVAPIARV